MPVEIIMPKVDMDMSHGTVAEWHVGEGEMVKKGFGPPINTDELPRICFPKVLKIRGCHENCRQLETLYFCRVP